MGRLHEQGIHSAVIGKMTPQQRTWVGEDGQRQELTYSPSDEIYLPYGRKEKA